MHVNNISLILLMSIASASVIKYNIFCMLLTFTLNPSTGFKGRPGDIGLPGLPGLPGEQGERGQPGTFLQALHFD